jgi:hypothetical protein
MDRVAAYDIEFKSAEHLIEQVLGRLVRTRLWPEGRLVAILAVTALAIAFRASDGAYFILAVVTDMALSEGNGGSCGQCSGGDRAPCEET